ncbi:MAG TPA: hypothetical protein VEW42_02105 [Candidatus Eisenbacteria bacterium]|nr:hypothetical protein [Candidatus Eisenbacteria bacterium]
MKNLSSKLKIYRLGITILLLTTYYLIHTTRVSASDFSLGIFPPIIQIQANVPTGIKKDITVVNASESPQDVSIVMKQFTNSPYSNGQVSYLPDNTIPHPDKDIFSKIQILDTDAPIDSITLAPKQKKTLTLRIGLPKDEPAGDYYFSILFISHNQVGDTQNGSVINAGIATNVLLSIGPKDPTTGFLEEFSTKWFYQTGPIPFTVSIANTSNHFITPTGQILIRNMFGQLVGKVDLLPVNILEQTSRYLPSKSAANSSYASWNEKVLFGAYSAHIIVSLSDAGPLFTRTIYFFVMPIQYIVGFFLAVTLVLIVIERVRHRIKSS